VLSRFDDAPPSISRQKKAREFSSADRQPEGRCHPGQRSPAREFPFEQARSSDFFLPGAPLAKTSAQHRYSISGIHTPRLAAFHALPKKDIGR